MGYYSVLEPCVVGKLHYATVPVQPIEVDDDVAGPLVEAGCLEQYQPGLWSERIEPGAFRKSLDTIHRLSQQVAAETPSGGDGSIPEGAWPAYQQAAEEDDKKPASRPRAPRRAKD